MFEGSKEGTRNIGVDIAGTLELSMEGWSSFCFGLCEELSDWWFNNDYSVFG